MPENIPPQLVAIALEHATGSGFEDFTNLFMSGLTGSEYVPLGGTADGGADGVYEYSGETDRPDHFLQASIEEEVRPKVRSTVKRLREVGRNLNSLTHVTPHKIPRLDLVEQDLSDELGVAVRIRDGAYIEAHINDSRQTQHAFSVLRPFIDFLNKIGGASSPHVSSQHVADTSAYVFLRQELDRRAGDFSLVDATVDALVMWALEGTDPDAGTLMPRQEILSKITGTLPAVKGLVQARLDARLEELSNKTYPGGRRINWHKSEDAFVLPYEARATVAEANAEDEALRLRVIDGFRARAAQLLSEEPTGLHDSAAKSAVRALEVLFESQGIEFARFVSSSNELESQPFTYVSDAVALALHQMGVAQANRESVGGAALEVLRKAFYSSTADERAFLGRLSRSFALLFSLQASPQVVEYFEDLTGDFNLLVGTDVLVRAMSERYLEPADQMHRNVLALARSAGATLVLTEPVLDEVVTHLRTTHQEYVSFVEPVAGQVNLEIARNSARILIRAYFYAKLDPDRQEKPNSWQDFVNQFVNPAILEKPAGHEAIRGYLENTFGMTFRSREELLPLVDVERVETIANELEKDKVHRDLAENDALMALSVYGLRGAAGEHSAGSEFGLRTWWLTAETKILRYTESDSKEHSGERYMMRPEFLLNFIALAPTAAEVRRTYANVFPSILGLQLAQRMTPDDFRGLMTEVKAATELEEGRRQAEMGQIVDRLKSDFDRQYVRTFDDKGEPDTLPLPDEDVL